jgi:predicted esterase
MLHGSGGNSEHGLGLLRNFADTNGLILLAPMSRASTWDIIIDNYGLDIEFMDQALTQVFGHYAVDPSRLAIGGFSDGASYGLSVGLINGDLFSHILAFSPGFVAPAAQQGEPDIFISHGLRDAVLPIDRCSRRIVPALRRSGYAVTYHEFDGPHTVPQDITQIAVGWFTAERG